MCKWAFYDPSLLPPAASLHPAGAALPGSPLTLRAGCLAPAICLGMEAAVKQGTPHIYSWPSPSSGAQHTAYTNGGILWGQPGPLNLVLQELQVLHAPGIIPAPDQVG